MKSLGALHCDRINEGLGQVNGQLRRQHFRILRLIEKMARADATVRSIERNHGLFHLLAEGSMDGGVAMVIHAIHPEAFPVGGYVAAVLNRVTFGRFLHSKRKDQIDFTLKRASWAVPFFLVPLVTATYASLTTSNLRREEHLRSSAKKRKELTRDWPRLQ